MAEPLLEKFKQEKVIDAPPDANLRTFNVNDILGDLDHDEHGNIVAPPKENDGKHHDKSGKETNPKGYLVDENKDVIENLNGEKMFSKDDWMREAKYQACLAGRNTISTHTSCRAMLNTPVMVSPS